MTPAPARPINTGRWLALGLIGAAASWATWSYVHDGIVGLLLDHTLAPEDKIDGLRAFFDGWGTLAPLMYLGLVTVEVVIAPIPGTLIYLPGGLIFGGAWGGTLSLAGNVLGAGLSCQLMRTIVGRRWMQSFIERDRLRRYQELIGRHGVTIVALLRINPLTSSDLVSYAAGFTTLRVTTVMLGTLVGMAPLCYVQAYLVAELFTTLPWLLWPLVGVCVIYAGVVVAVVLRLGRPGQRDITGTSL